MFTTGLVFFIAAPFSSCSIQIRSRIMKAFSFSDCSGVNLYCALKSKLHVRNKREIQFAENQFLQVPEGDLNTEVQPLMWKEQLEGMKVMRLKYRAAVDDAGAEAIALSVSAYYPKISLKDRRFQILLATMLSSQTRDNATSLACEGLRQLCYPDPVSANLLMQKSEQQILEAIRPVSFHKTKAQRVLDISRVLSAQYDGDIPYGNALLDLPGVGPKVMTLVMDIAWNENIGICVDTHVHRISNRLGWAKTWKGTDSNGRVRSQVPERTRVALESWLPREHWSEINDVMVGFGQEICKAVAPKCKICEIAHICPVATRGGKLS